MENNNRNHKSFLNEENYPSQNINSNDIKITRNIEIDYDDQVNLIIKSKLNIQLN
jgi:hypothetical protein